MIPHTHTAADNAAGMIPEFLCRKCHPELTKPQAVRQVIEDAARSADFARQRLQSKMREVHQTERSLASKVKSNSLPGTPGYKIEMALVKKLARVKLELAAMQ